MKTLVCFLPDVCGVNLDKSLFLSGHLICATVKASPPLRTLSGLECRGSVAVNVCVCASGLSTPGISS